MKSSIFVLVFLSSKLFSQADSIVKVFSTDLMRANVLKGKPKDKIKKMEECGITVAKSPSIIGKTLFNKLSN